MKSVSFKETDFLVLNMKSIFNLKIIYLASINSYSLVSFFFPALDEINLSRE